MGHVESLHCRGCLLGAVVRRSLVPFVVEPINPLKDTGGKRRYLN